MDKQSLAPAWFDILKNEVNGEKKDFVDPSQKSGETNGEKQDS